MPVAGAIDAVCLQLAHGAYGLCGTVSGQPKPELDSTQVAAKTATSSPVCVSVQYAWRNRSGKLIDLFAHRHR